jgi:hypothetical protein
MKNTVEFSEKINIGERTARAYQTDDFVLDEPNILDSMDENLIIFEEDLEGGGGIPSESGHDVSFHESDHSGHSHDEGLEIIDEDPDADALPAVEWVEELGLEELAKETVDEATEYVERLEEEYEDVDGTIMVNDDGTAFVVPGTELEIDPKADLDNSAIETTWADDRDPGMFMNYLESSYPGGIPAHDGNSMVGCEKAIVYLNSLNKEISEALRSDKVSLLDPMVLEDYRVKLLRDMVLLKDRMTNLKRDLSDSARNMSKASSGAELQKEGGTPIVQTVATPFERAVAGILINSVVSAGHSFEDVYDYLKAKYALDERDELSVMQLVMDSGFHIFKDRGTIGTNCSDTETDAGGNISSHGVDFIKNYFA